MKIILATVISLLIPVPFVYPNPCFPAQAACIQVLDLKVLPLGLHLWGLGWWNGSDSLIALVLLLIVFLASFAMLSKIASFKKNESVPKVGHS